MSAQKSQWQTTDEGAPVRINAKGNPQAALPVDGSTISRKPAAAIGILAVLTVIVVGTGGMDSLLGQVDSGITVRITSDGFVPAHLVIHPGDTVTWRNEDSIPHIIASATLATTDSDPLESEPIFPGDSFTTTIADTANPGPHTYISRTASLDGGIDVQSGAADADASSSIGEQESSFSEVSTVMEQSSSSTQETTEPDIVTQTNTTAPAIPVNPHTVPFTSLSTTPTPTAQGGPTPTKPLPTAPSQPSSGIGLHLTLAAALLLFWRVTRKSLRA